MQTFPEFAVMMARFNMGGGEIILILALVLILFGARRLPELARGLRRGILLFGEASKDVADDQKAMAAGRLIQRDGRWVEVAAPGLELDSLEDGSSTGQRLYNGKAFGNSLVFCRNRETFFFYRKAGKSCLRSVQSSCKISKRQVLNPIHIMPSATRSAKISTMFFG